MDFFSACNDMASDVTESISDLVGTAEGGITLKMGADKTPTKKIDQVAEDCVLHYLQENSLCSLLISEEAGRVEMDGGEGTIFLDPVDGTFNALAGIPFYALSLAYAREGVIEKAFVRNLAFEETFTAELGVSARCNGKSIHTSDIANLDECAVSVYGRKFNPSGVMHLGQKIRRWRLLGASALELCYVASGRIDAFIDLRGTLRVTDAAAGMLICAEAGGRVTDLEGNKIQFPDDVSIGRCLIATNGIVHHKVIEYLR
ncbi:bifunctional fructose-bisphosphatase/inositol-phosphate phosphatase [uncultured Methanoregula sp.]|uniref:bifunctional fructose-bisphosphatase/inositol-phosphate phosphatase n=1 Tax=uncultured Methanoregula sp. TaxID=1005933 RepID=UPI002AAB0889|nr:bifunctional fructose-bisphosphatase/inositol-phosphate phosphatase [uncultured Methanoregula sp.]